MLYSEYDTRIRKCDDVVQLSSLAGLAFVDAEISTSELTLIQRQIEEKMERLKKGCKEIEAMRRTRGRHIGE